jgi:tetrahydromethanopterin S-methyltransferase subunit G
MAEMTWTDDKLDALDGRFAELEKTVHDGFARAAVEYARTDARLTAVGERFDEVERRFDEVDRRFDRVDARFDRIDAKFDALHQMLLQVFAGLIGSVTVSATAIVIAMQ